MIHHPNALFNPKTPLPPGNSLDIAALRFLWKSFREKEGTAPVKQRLGIALLRTKLLSSFPTWRLLDILDELNRPEADATNVDRLVTKIGDGRKAAHAK